MMNFTLKQLRYFTVAGEHRSVTKAAELLYVSQPSISSAILHLEEVTGLQLFIRHHAQGLSLTPQGQQFYRRARKLLKEAEDLSHFAGSLGSDISGTLNIVGFPTFTSLMMPALIKEFVGRYPDVYVDCQEMPQKELIQNILDCNYEIGITYDMELPANIEFQPLVSLPPFAVVSRDHELAGRDSVSITELAELPMVMLDWPVSRQYFMSLFISRDLRPECRYRTQSLTMARGMVANGFGYSLFNMPLSSDTALDGSRLKAIPIDEELTPLTMGVVKLAQSHLTPAAQAFIELLQDSVAEEQNNSGTQDAEDTALVTPGLDQKNKNTAQEIRIGG
ncbi:MAG: LysR family transcriptional regulator [Oceanospirillaceae bacterium]|nr:LysR family transcriptional regulator [Oceanospirillaceae bacterium]MBT10441.1 LysR family transcriptional regulator [Oceanospirillaceae bacterium]|tara:strand:- start:40059 stop:41063 length:1005 start_codon:yes stop_codon:yes gene_type:complete